MKPANKTLKALLLMAACLLASAAFAQNGADDPLGHNAADDKGGITSTGPAQNDRPKVATRIMLVDNPDDPAMVKGQARHILKGDREELRVQAKIKDDALPDANAAAAATVQAKFVTTGSPDVLCEMEFDEFNRGKAEFDLRLRQRNGNLEEKEGTCGGVMPTITAGDTHVDILLEGADPANPRLLATGQF